MVDALDLGSSSLIRSVGSSPISRTIMQGGEVNRYQLKQAACPYPTPTLGESEMFGMLTDARPRTRMFSAAIESARPEKPQTTQEKVD